MIVYSFILNYLKRIQTMFSDEWHNFLLIIYRRRILHSNEYFIVVQRTKQKVYEDIYLLVAINNAVTMR